MTKLKLIICIFLVAVPLLGQNKANLKIVCYNLRFGELASLEELGKFILSENPDVVMLQEVDIFTNREQAPKQNGKNFIAELGYYTNMMSVFGKAINHKGGYYGVGILSKYPIANSERIFLPMVEQGREQRILLLARIELNDNQQITIATSHLDLKSEIRQVQVDSINKILSKEKNPVLLAGDFNADPSSKEIHEGMKNWKYMGKATDYTSPAKDPKSKIDYIFYHPGKIWKEISYKVVPVKFSDHCPIVGEMTLQE